jgi:hypothetical protein
MLPPPPRRLAAPWLEGACPAGWLLAGGVPAAAGESVVVAPLAAGAAGAVVLGAVVLGTVVVEGAVVVAAGVLVELAGAAAFPPP